MNLIVHDLENLTFNKIFNFNDRENYIISDNGSIKSCTGCFGCWIKTPGTCVIKDGYENTGRLFSKADNVLIFSRCYYGGYSPFVKWQHNGNKYYKWQPETGTQHIRIYN